MHDQADALRQLVVGAESEPSPRPRLTPWLVAVAGGKGGVGTTTIAVNLAVAAVRHGLRVVLVDANFQQPDAAMLCGLDHRETITDVLEGRRTVAEVLQSGPAGIRVVPGDWAPDTKVNCPPQAHQRLVMALERLGCQADLVVVDMGNGRNHAAQRLWQTADLVLLVTMPDRVSVLDAYAAIKSHASGAVATEIVTVVNQLAPEQNGLDIQIRIEQTCRRFLGRTVHRGPTVRFDPDAMAAAQAGRPLVASAPDGPAGKGLTQLATEVVQRLQRSAPPRDVPPHAPSRQATAEIEVTMAS